MADRPTRLHDCPGCRRKQIPYRLLACPQCWHRLPDEIRRKVNIAWSRRRIDREGHQRAVQVAIAWYRDNALEVALAVNQAEQSIARMTPASAAWPRPNQTGA